VSKKCFRSAGTEFRVPKLFCELKNLKTSAPHGCSTVCVGCVYIWIYDIEMRACDEISLAREGLLKGRERKSASSIRYQGEAWTPPGASRSQDYFSFRCCRILFRLTEPLEFSQVTLFDISSMSNRVVYDSTCW